MKTLLRVFSDPFTQFASWYSDAKNCDSIRRPNSAFLSTVDGSGVPMATVVLVTSLDEHFDRHDASFCLKANSLAAELIYRNPAAALTFYWDPLWRQVRLGGRTELLDKIGPACPDAVRASGSEDAAFRIIPDWFEFWQGRKFRLHDRYLYTRSGDTTWKVTRLFP